MSLDRRREAAVRLLEEHSLDVLVGIGGSVHNFLQCEPVLVLAGFRTIGASAAVIDRGGAVTLLVSPAWDAARAKRTAARNTGVEGVADLPAALHALVGGKKAGFAGLDLLTSGVAARVKDALGTGAQDLEQGVRRIDQVRSEEEFENARRATEIAERGYERLLETARAGLAEYELAAELYCYMRGLGSEDNFLLMNSSQHGIGVGPPGRRIMEEGDLILAEITPSYGWQFSQVCRTVSIGKPPASTYERYALLQQSMRVGLASAVPGTTVAATTDAMNRVLIEAGYGDYCKPPYMRVRGHGLGNLSDLPGDIDSDNHMAFAKDMFFVMHPNQYLPETGYMMCGEPVRIGERGAVPLTKSFAQLDWVKP